MVSFGNARMKSRDGKRLSDIHQVKVGLDLFYTTAEGYPDAALWNSGALTCNGNHILTVPRDPLLYSYYVYTTQLPTVTGCGGTLSRDYKVEFTTEAATELGAAGTYYLSPRGISTVDPF